MQFEIDLLELTKSGKFKKTKNKFLGQLHTRTWSIKKSKNVFIFSDKTYKRIFMKQIKTCTINCYGIASPKYTKTEHGVYNKIRKEAKTILNNYGVSERADCLAKSNAFISLKDDQLNFISNPK